MHIFKKGEPNWVGPLNQNFEDVSNHVASVDNPHRVTAKQVGAWPLLYTDIIAPTTQTPGYANADEWTTPGSAIAIPTYTAAQSVDNLPVPAPGTMVVLCERFQEEKSDLRQVYICDDGGVYSRPKYYYDQNTWKRWRSNLPTSGTNANGSWVQWPDGTMITYGKLTSQTVPPNSTVGIQETSIPLPVMFIGDTPNISLTPLLDTGMGAVSVKLGGVTRSAFWGSVTNFISIERTVEIHWQATGRWK